MRYTIPVTLTLRGPFLTQGTSPGAFGLDAVCERDQNDRLVVPGTLLAGKLREAWTNLKSITADAFAFPADSWLGQESASGSKDQPARRSLLIPDLTERNPPANREVPPLPRVKRDPHTEALEPGMLALLEPGALPGASIEFSGDLTAFCAPNQLEELLVGLRAGLGWMTQLGSQRSVGYGRLLAASIAETVAFDYALPPTPLNQSLLAFQITPHSTFCLAGKRFGSEKGDNLFDSQKEIPGAAIKGALASTWAAALGTPGTSVAGLEDPHRPRLKEHFDRIRFTHAKPSAAGGGRAVQWPLSLVGGKRVMRDALEHSIEALVAAFGHSPSFEPDWKDEWKHVPPAYGWRDPATLLRVRTAIDPEKRRPAEDKLFAYECVVPDVNTVWLAAVDLSRIADAAERQQVAAELADLMQRGLHFLGKTKTRASIELLDRLEPAVRSRPIDDGERWTLTLQSACLLCDPDAVVHGEPSSLRTAYEAVFAELSGGLLELENFFAQQGLYGGGYLHRRFGKPTYRPYLLSEAGSCFRLKPASRESIADARRCLACWLERGLELPRWAKKVHGSTWDTNPYLPENGYGEVAIDLELPAALAGPTAAESAP